MGIPIGPSCSSISCLRSKGGREAGADYVEFFFGLRKLDVIFRVRDLAFFFSHVGCGLFFFVLKMLQLFFWFCFVKRRFSPLAP